MEYLTLEQRLTRDAVDETLTHLYDGENLAVAHNRCRYIFTTDNAMDILQKEAGEVFARVPEHAGVCKRTAEGRAAFLRFIGSVC